MLIDLCRETRCTSEWRSRNSWAGLDGKESSCNAGDLGLILGQEDPLEKGMATHSSLLAWRILWTEEISELQSMGSQRVGHDWVTYTFRRWSTRKLISELLLLLHYKCLGAIEFSHSWWISPTSFNSNDRNPIQTHLNWNKEIHPLSWLRGPKGISSSADLS